MTYGGQTGLDIQQRQQITDLVTAMLDQMKRRSPGPELHVGTVQTAAPGSSWTVAVMLAGPDSPIIYPQNITNDPLIPGERVMVMMAPEGAFVVGSFQNQFGLLAYDYNTATVSGGVTTAWVATNLQCLVVFPNSGKVRVKMNGTFYSNGLAVGQYISLRVWDQTNGVQLVDGFGNNVLGRVTTGNAGAKSDKVHWEHVVQGLVPGNSAQWRLEMACSAAPSTDFGLSAGAAGAIPRFEIYAEPFFPNTAG